MSLRVAIVGCGSTGARRAQMLRTLGIEQLTVADRVPDRARALASTVGADMGESIAATAANSDAVLICTPLATRPTVALSVAREGAHVFVESPVSDVLERIGPLVDVVTRKRRVLMVGSWARFHPALERIRALLDARTIGRLHVASVWVGGSVPGASEDGVASDVPTGRGEDLTPWLDAVRWLFGNPLEVAAVSAHVPGGRSLNEAVNAGILRLERGGIVQLCIDATHGVESTRIDVVGTDGSICWTPHDGRIAVNRLGGRERRDEQVPADGHAIASAEMRHFLACVLTGRSPAMDGPEARAVLGLTLATRRAVRTRRSIALGDYLRGGRRSPATPLLRLVHAG
jgi:predicted dehydrogenase